MTTIPVAKPFLPPLAELMPYLNEIWANQLLTNGGPLHQQLENELSARWFSDSFVSLCSNGTLALVTALQAMDVQGEVITTPYSFVATSHSLGWLKAKPVFVDIEPVTFNLDPEKITKAITPKTNAILAVHCYGKPCDVFGIQAVAEKFGLRVIYDAAHAFGVLDQNKQSIVRYGDISAMSFHATKVFNTFEGGAVFAKSESIKRKIDRLKNFGIDDEVTVSSLGLNAKMSEFNAALGLLQLKYINQCIERRARIDVLYREYLGQTSGIKIPPHVAGWTSNHSYFPILVGPAYHESRDELYERLKRYGMYSRRYFYPLISTYPMYSGLESADPQNLPVATEVADQILCLPIYPDLTDEDVANVTNVIRMKS